MSGDILNKFQQFVQAGTVDDRGFKHEGHLGVEAGGEFWYRGMEVCNERDMLLLDDRLKCRFLAVYANLRVQAAWKAERKTKDWRREDIERLLAFRYP
jgi:hypothetical protein